MRVRTPASAALERVAVIGAGVIGLSIAHELRSRGYRVVVHRDRPTAESVSALAGAVWFPFEAGPPARVRHWSLRTYQRLMALADTRIPGVEMKEGLIVRRTERAPEWASWLPQIREARRHELPPGADHGYVVVTPVIEMPVYLSWLEAGCRRLDVEVIERRVEELEDVFTEVDVVVVAAGISSAGLVADHELVPIRGQVVRVRNPGLRRWYLDEDNPQGLTYAIPRSHDVVCGGSAESHPDGERVDQLEETRILARARSLVPELASCDVLSNGVGVRPGRSEIRLEVISGLAKPVLACYGHGGAGVTVSWGCAEEVASLL